MYQIYFQVRDHALKIAESLPTSTVNREYYLQNVDSALEQSGDHGPGGALGQYSPVTGGGGRFVYDSLVKRRKKNELLTHFFTRDPKSKQDPEPLCCCFSFT